MTARLLPRRAYGLAAAPGARRGRGRRREPVAAIRAASLRVSISRRDGIVVPRLRCDAAVFALSHGDVALAVRCNALLVPALLLVAYLWVSPYLIARFGRFGRHATELPTAVLWSVFAVTAVFGVLRNTPMFHGTLAPPALP